MEEDAFEGLTINREKPQGEDAMHLPKGFKVDGTKTSDTGLIPPRAKKVIQVLDALPFGELLTSAALAARIGAPLSGGVVQSSVLADYREKVDGSRLYWGNQKSITKLRVQLAEPEDTNENQ